MHSEQVLNLGVGFSWWLVVLELVVTELVAKCELRGNGGGAHRGVSPERGEASTNGTVMELCCRGSTLR